MNLYSLYNKMLIRKGTTNIYKLMFAPKTLANILRRKKIMAENFKSYKKQEWWREAGEVTDSERRISESTNKPVRKEAYELKKGSDGRNLPSVTTKYAKKSGQKKMEKNISVKKYVEAEDFEDEEDIVDDMDDMDDSDLDMGDESINDESGVPVETDEPMADGGCVCSCPACGAKLVIEVEPEDNGLDNDMEDESMEDESVSDLESEDSDLTVPKLESKKDKFDKYLRKTEMKTGKKSSTSEKSFEEAYEAWKAERKARLNKKRKNEAESCIGVKYGSDSHSMVRDGQTNSGSKTDVGAGNEDDFGISSTDNDVIARGKTNSGSKSSISNSGARTTERKKMTKKVIKEEEAAITDPFEDNDDLEGMIDGDEYADLPIDIGADSDQIEKYEAVKNRRKNRSINESTSAKSFDFKKLVRGEY